MTNKEKLIKYKKDFEQLYPLYKIEKLDNCSSCFYFRDENNFLHKKINISRFFNKPKIGIESAVNKIKYAHFLLKRYNKDLKLLKFNGVKESCLVEDKEGFKYSVQFYDILRHPVTITSCIEKEKLFIYKANIKHNNYYKYPNFIYFNGKQKIEILCPLHGLFVQTIESHLFGNGCRKCNCIGFTKKSWIERLKNKECCFYILEFYSENEKFLKIGITSKDVYKRYENLTDYNYKELYTLYGDASFIFDIEKAILKNFKTQKYCPNILFAGYTECLKYDILDKLKQFINEQQKNK